jgi:UDP-N-acetylmuramyl pentapeptide phosphotransferase/UDP-N-acetylglucosamine-1-phosphate transferase
VVFVLLALVASLLACLLRSAPLLSTLPLVVSPFMAVPLALVGFLDDRYNISAGWRYGVQLSTALVVTLTSPLLAPSFSLLPLVVFLSIAVTAVINFTNFMDGLDGLVAGCMVVVISAAAIQLAAPWSTWALVGALLGFLFWNWSPASVFMGDVGSTFLGGVFAIFVLQASTWLEALALLLVATPLMADACLCVLRRLIAGHRLLQAHRLHLFQRLHQAGWSHARVSSVYISATALLAMALVWHGLPWLITLAAIEILVGFWLDQQVAVPFLVASRS